uniref:PHD-type domain-containing protein n=1 Tax=Kalanchoe fedtschenkoi TaxID=63787 RepID=A0A7N0UD84_KALFE
MKRELLFALEQQEKLGCSLSRTRSGKVGVSDWSASNGVGKRKPSGVSFVGGLSVMRITRSSVRGLGDDELVTPDRMPVAFPGIDGISEVGVKNEKGGGVLESAEQGELGGSVGSIQVSEAGNVDSYGANGTCVTVSNQKRDGVSPVGGLTVKRLTRSSLKIMGKIEHDPLSEDMKLLGIARTGGLQDIGGGDEKHELNSVLKEQEKPVGLTQSPKSENLDSLVSSAARNKDPQKKRKGHFSQGGFVKRFTRSSIKVRETSVDEAVVADQNAINVPGPEILLDVQDVTPSFDSSKKSKQALENSRNTNQGSTRLSTKRIVSDSGKVTNPHMTFSEDNQSSLDRSSSEFVKSTQSSSFRRSKQGRKSGTPTTKPLPGSKSYQIAVVMPSWKKDGYKITRKDLRVHRVVFQKDGLPDGTELGYYVRGEKLLEGYKKGDGIVCGCCDSEVSASTFEAHAGCAQRRKPYHHIFTSNGVSLHEFAVDLLKGRDMSTEESDNICLICADGGELLCCDMCPRAFHLECLKLSHIPRGKWFCNYCSTMFERDNAVTRNANAIAAGRVSGVNPIKQITERCIRIVNMVDNDVTACALCRACDYSQSGFDPRTIIICDQCELEFHVGCLRSHEMADLKELPEGKWFCGQNCNTIYSCLQNLLNLGEVELPDIYLAPAKKKQQGKGPDSYPDLNVKWRLLKGELASSETGPLLSKSVAIFRDCFDPIKDINGKDLIPFMVYGKNTKSFEYGVLLLYLLDFLEYMDTIWLNYL